MTDAKLLFVDLVFTMLLKGTPRCVMLYQNEKQEARMTMIRQKLIPTNPTRHTAPKWETRTATICQKLIPTSTHWRKKNAKCQAHTVSTLLGQNPPENRVKFPPQTITSLHATWNNDERRKNDLLWAWPQTQRQPTLRLLTRRAADLLYWRLTAIHPIMKWTSYKKWHADTLHKNAMPNKRCTPSTFHWGHANYTLPNITTPTHDCS